MNRAELLEILAIERDHEKALGQILEVLKHELRLFSAHIRVPELNDPRHLQLLVASSHFESAIKSVVGSTNSIRRKAGDGGPSYFIDNQVSSREKLVGSDQSLSDRYLEYAYAVTGCLSISLYPPVDNSSDQGGCIGVLALRRNNAISFTDEEARRVIADYSQIVMSRMEWLRRQDRRFGAEKAKEVIHTYHIPSTNDKAEAYQTFKENTLKRAIELANLSEGNALALIRFRNKLTDHLHLEAHYPRNDTYVPPQLPAAHGVAGRVTIDRISRIVMTPQDEHMVELREKYPGNAVVKNNVEAHRMAEYVRSFDSLVVVPLSISEEVTGTLSVLSKEPASFSIRALDKLEGFAEEIAEELFLCDLQFREMRYQPLLAGVIQSQEKMLATATDGDAHKIAISSARDTTGLGMSDCLVVQLTLVNNRIKLTCLDSDHSSVRYVPDKEYAIRPSRFKGVSVSSVHANQGGSMVADSQPLCHPDKPTMLDHLSEHLDLDEIAIIPIDAKDGLGTFLVAGNREGGQISEYELALLELLGKGVMVSKARREATKLEFEAEKSAWTTLKDTLGHTITGSISNLQVHLLRAQSALSDHHASVEGQSRLDIACREVKSACDVTRRINSWMMDFRNTPIDFFPPERFSLSSAVAHMIDQNWDVEVVSEGQISDSVYVLYNRTLFKILCDEMISNAVRALAKKVVVKVDARSRKFVASVTFKNDGKQIPIGIRERIYAVGYSGSGGTGLGLPMLKHHSSKFGAGLVLLYSNSRSTAFRIDLKG